MNSEGVWLMAITLQLKKQMTSYGWCRSALRNGTRAIPVETMTLPSEKEVYMACGFLCKTLEATHTWALPCSSPRPWGLIEEDIAR